MEDMNDKNEVEVIDKKQYGMKVRKGDSEVEVSPEMAGEILDKVMNLGAAYIAGIENVTHQMFMKTSEMYYEQLDAYLKNQTIKSNERKMMLQKLNELTDKYSDLINETDDVEKKELLMKTYKFFAEEQEKLYITALDKDVTTSVPKPPKLFGGLKKLLSKKSN
ncbi:hypothetical protein [Catenibacterium sp.]|uniref:hypothetical protein n=1 Tax=Catenibacterium sp. TaxID=2049022 RepID=UPI003995BFAE